MALTSIDVDNKSFSVERKGYSIEEVDIFLETVSKEIGIMNDTIAQLQKKSSGVSEEVLANLNKEKELVAAKVAQRDQHIEQLKQELANKKDDSSAISQALIVAQRSADAVVEEANKKAQDIINDAKEQANRIVAGANSDKENIEKQLKELDVKRNKAKDSYEKMLHDIVDTMNIHLDDLESGKYKNPAFGKTGAIKKKTGAHSAASAKTTAGSTTSSKAVKQQSIPVAAPVKPESQKDFSGFGDTDFGGGSID